MDSSRYSEHGHAPMPRIINALALGSVSAPSWLEALVLETNIKTEVNYSLLYRFFSDIIEIPKPHQNQFAMVKTFHADGHDTGYEVRDNQLDQVPGFNLLNRVTHWSISKQDNHWFR